MTDTTPPTGPLSGSETVSGDGRLRIAVIGASGDIGRTVTADLGVRHDIITVGRTSGDVIADLTDRASIEAMYAAIGPLDAVVCTAGNVHFGPLPDFTGDQMMFGLTHKLMAQVNLVLAGLDAVADNGSFTLTSGILNRDPVRAGIGAATANGALDAFVFAGAIEMPRGIRINGVSPGLLDVSASRYGAFFPGHIPVSSERVAAAYRKSVEGAQTGQVFIVD